MVNAAKNIAVEKISLPVEGMTCASCVARVEKAIKKIDGVKEVSVNLATEKATVEFEKSKVDVEKIANRVEDAGYKIILPTKDKSTAERKENKNDYEVKLRKDFLLAAILSFPILLINM
jgi:Cu+-exporting ATPase